MRTGNHAENQARVLEERARKREAIGLAPQRPTAKAVLHSPPEAKGRSLLWPVVVLSVLGVTGLLYVWCGLPYSPSNGRTPCIRWPGVPVEDLAGHAFLPDANERLILRDDFSDPQLPLRIHTDAEYALGFLGDLYQIRVERSGTLAWTTLGQLDLGAYRLETDLRLSADQEFAWGFGGVIVRFQNDESFYLFAIDRRGQYQMQLVHNGIWRTIQPWTPTTALTDKRQTVLAVVDDGITLRFIINGMQVDEVPDPQLPSGDVGLVVGARSHGQARGLFDWVALYEIPLAE